MSDLHFHNTDSKCAVIEKDGRIIHTFAGPVRTLGEPMDDGRSFRLKILSHDTVLEFTTLNNRILVNGEDLTNKGAAFICYRICLLVFKTPATEGEPGATGKSAYQIWLDDGNTGTESDFVNSLRAIGSSSYVHDQAIPANIWHVPHGLNCYPAGIVVIDNLGNHWLVEPVYVDLNNLDLPMGTATFSGIAYISS